MIGDLDLRGKIDGHKSMDKQPNRCQNYEICEVGIGSDVFRKEYQGIDIQNTCP